MKLEWKRVSDHTATVVAYADGAEYRVQPVMRTHAILTVYRFASGRRELADTQGFDSDERRSAASHAKRAALQMARAAAADTRL